MVGAYPIFIKYGSKGSQKSYLNVNKYAWGFPFFFVTPPHLSPTLIKDNIIIDEWEIILSW